MALIEINNLKKKFGKVEVLKGINLEVSEGEIFGFIGPNGAGKSTTIRCLLGLLKASGGSCYINDLNVWHNNVAIHKDIAYIPGDVNLWPNLTGGEIIDFFLNLKKQKHSAKTDDLIKKFAFDPSKKARSYSKGNRQKVALIAALSSDVPLYLFDEPTSGLDPLMEKVFQQEVFELKKEGKTIFLSSHVLSEVEELCDRIAIIKEGTIIETGSLKEMRHLTRLNIEIESQDNIEELSTLSGVYHFENIADNYKFQVDSDKIGTIMHLISKYEISNFISMPPTLEDLFLRYYGNEKGGQDE